MRECTAAEASLRTSLRFSLPPPTFFTLSFRLFFKRAARILSYKRGGDPHCYAPPALLLFLVKSDRCYCCPGVLAARPPFVAVTVRLRGVRYRYPFVSLPVEHVLVACVSCAEIEDTTYNSSSIPFVTTED